MGQYSDFEDLMDMVAEEPGWQLLPGQGYGAFKIVPPDKTKALIHVSKCYDKNQVDNIRARLRRAGFKSLIKDHAEKKLTTIAKPEPAKQTAAISKPRDLIAEARAHVGVALDALAGLDRLLGEIAADQESVTKIKQLLQQVLK